VVSYSFRRIGLKDDNAMKVFWDPVQLSHEPHFFLLRGQPRPNFEVPARAEALLAACRAMAMAVETPPPVDRAILATVHDPAYLDFLRDGFAAWSALPDSGGEMVANSHPAPEMVANGARPPRHIVGQVGWFTADAACPIGAGTWPSAVAAAADAVAAADEAAAGRNAYALARPPGHHTYRAKAGGHCYLNNAALAAERLRAKGASRVAVLDIDSHHGNGTQGIFWYRGDVLFVSVHGDPDQYYPWFTGRADERGAGAGESCNLNLPLPIGTGDAGWLSAVRTGVDAVTAFGAETVVVSLGFDASVDEPLNALSVSADGFARAGTAIGSLGLPTVIVQEGGYAVHVLGELLTRFMTGFGGA
jgi:acetoin utilization deacetylase AcuC-like enzyme